MPYTYIDDGTDGTALMIQKVRSGIMVQLYC